MARAEVNPPESPLERLGADRVSEAFMARLIDSSRDCIKVLDLDGRLLSVNAGGIDALEIRDLAALVGSLWIDFWQGADHEAAAVAVDTARRGEVGRFVGFFPTTQTRTPKWWDVVVSAICDPTGKPEKLLAVSRDVTEWKRSENLLRVLNAERQALLDVNRAVSRHLERDELFGQIAACLGNLFETDRFGIELPIEGNRLQGHILTPNAGHPIPTRVKVLPTEGTACNWVLQARQRLVTGSRAEVRERFPLTYEVMSHEGMESLCAMPLISDDRACGVLYFMAARHAAYEELPRALLEQVAGAVAVALDDCLAHEELREKSRQALTESEDRFRDLFDEAPIAYVHEGLDTRFIRANRTAMRILGITPEEIAGTYGRTFIPDTPDAQGRLREALESIGRGTDTSGVVLELRRKDNGKPIWIQWWSRPDPSTTYTRTMFIDITDRVLIEQEKARLEAQNTYLQEEIRSDHNFEEIVGNSPPLLDVLRKVERVAGTDSTVLILGETGTGKELFARAIHSRSSRRDRPLVKVNCGAIAAGLVESELFGHVKGAFTGAIQRRIGRFELADGGTIFLDEVGELPLDTQAKLLRVLQEHEFEPVGSSQTVRVDVRVIAATNRDFDESVRSGRFRADLLYRLNVFPLRVPALRERPEDIPLLISFFVTTLAKKLGKPLEGFSRSAMEQLIRYPWPGNVRELQNIVERAAILAQTPVLEVESHLLGQSDRPTPSQLLGALPDPETESPPSLEQMERSYIINVLRATHGVVEGPRGAAGVLDLHPNTLRSRIKKLAIQRSDYEIS
jgi:formate hydrogenlyase transcriptional activator